MAPVPQPGEHRGHRQGHEDDRPPTHGPVRGEHSEAHPAVEAQGQVQHRQHWYARPVEVHQGGLLGGSVNADDAEDEEERGVAIAHRSA